MRFRKPKAENIFLFFFLILSAYNFLLISVFDEETNLLFFRVVNVVFLAVVFLIQRKITRWDAMIVFAVLYLFIINGAITMNVAFLLIVFVAFGKFKTDVVSKYILITLLLVVAIVLVLLQTEQIENSRWENQGRVRFLLGFENANYPGILSFSLVSMFLCNKKRISLYDIGFSLVFLYIIFSVTDSRTSFITGVFLCMFYLFIKKFHTRFIEWGVVFVEIISFASPFFWSLSRVNTPQFNKLFSNRPMLYYNYINQNTWRELIFGGSTVDEIDGFYPLLLFNVGIIIYVAFATLVVIATKKLFKKERYIDIAFVVAVIILSWMESSIARPELIAFTYFWVIIYQNTFAFVVNYDKTTRSIGKELKHDVLLKI